MEQILFYHIWGLQTFWSSDLNYLMNNLSNSPVISEKQMFRWVCRSPNEWPWIKGHGSAWLLVLNTRFFRNKCIRNQIWPCHKVGQPRLIICANLVEPTSPMLHTKSQGHWPFDSREDILRGFTIYEHCGHLGHVTSTQPIIRSFHMKFEFKWHSGFWGNYVLMCWWDSNMSDLGWKVKGQPWPWNLFIVIVLSHLVQHIRWE